MNKNTRTLKEIRYTQCMASLDAIYGHLHKVAGLFIPNLLERVSDLRGYAKKIKDNAVVFEAWDDGKLAGMLAAYFNNQDTRVGYVTALSVEKDYQGAGIAKKLLLNSVQYGKEKRFIKIRLEVGAKNEVAISFYKKMGFAVADKTAQKNSFMMELSI